MADASVTFFALFHQIVNTDKCLHGKGSSGALIEAHLRRVIMVGLYDG